MTKVIKELTPEQEARIPVFIEKWVKKASEPINRDKLPETVKKLFGEGKTVVIGESLQNTTDLIRVATGDRKITRQLDSQLLSQLYSQLDSQLRSQLYSQLRSQLRSQLDSQLRSQLDSQLLSQLYSQLRSQLDSKDIKYDFYVGLWWASWNGWYDYAKYIGVKFNEDALQLFNDYQETLPIAIFVGDVIFVCEKPECFWNEQGQLHSVKHPAIRWKDGTGIYNLNGVQFPEEMFIKVTQDPEDGGLPNKERAAYILAIEDVDQRTQAMRFLPPKDLIEALNGKEIDSVEKIASDGTPSYYKLVTFPKGDVFTTDAYYMYFNCPSTNKEHIEGVIESKTVKEAMAWREDTTEEEWMLKVPLVHET